jgi:PAS domain S-box-containing protein
MDGGKSWESLQKELEGLRLRVAPMEEEACARERKEPNHEQLNALDQPVLDLIPVAVFQKDLRGVYTRCNKEFERSLGRSREQIVGKTVYEVAPKELADIYHAKDMELARNGGVQIYEAIVAGACGEQRNVVFYKSVCKDRFGEPTGLIGVIYDITERKRAEECRKQSEQRYRTLFDNANDAVFILRGDQFIDCNKVALRMFGCTKEQLIGRPPQVFSPLVQPDGCDSEQKAKERVERAISGEFQHFDWAHCRLDGTPFDAEVSLSAIKVGEETLTQAVVRDVTERKKTEQDRERLILELKDALARIRTLGGLLPICACCKKIRDDQGYWTQIESYIRAHSDAEFSHSICPECVKRIYPEFGGR